MTELSLWMHLHDGRPDPFDRFVVGADVGTGTGATNSVACGANVLTGEKVAELVTARLSPELFAERVVGLCKWLNNAYLIWELNGPGSQFAKATLDLGYLNVYFRQDEQSLSRKVTDKPGWSATAENKRKLFGAYARALGTGRYVNRSKPALEECRQVVYLPDGKVGNNRTTAILDPSGARENHADRPTADALCCKGLEEQGGLKIEPDKAPEPPPELSFEGRRKLREQARREADAW